MRSSVLTCARRGEPVRVGQRQHERFRVELARHQGLILHRQRQNADVDLAIMQPLEHGFCAVLVQHEFEPRQGLADPERHLRQQVRAHGRQQRQAQHTCQRVAPVSATP